MKILPESESKSLTYDLVHDMAQILNKCKDYEVGYGNPRKGKMIVHTKNTNFLVTIEALDHESLENAMRDYGYLFRDRPGDDT